MKPRLSTDQDLVRILIGWCMRKGVNANRYKLILIRAKTNEYHDFKAETSVTPKLDLANDLAPFPELSWLRNAVIAGRFDEKPDDEDLAALKKYLRDDGASEEFISMILGD